VPLHHDDVTLRDNPLHLTSRPARKHTLEGITTSHLDFPTKMGRIRMGCGMSAGDMGWDIAEEAGQLYSSIVICIYAGLIKTI
jgi:hypothetical protein